tara:strand:+ start:836 stop:1033 length:198 start_codon:yes stop_codon:yes gene_type:complete
MTTDPTTILADGLRDGFVEFLEGDDDILEILMDKLAPFLDEKIPFVDEETRYDIGLQIVSHLSIR